MSNLTKLLDQTGGIRPGLTGCELIRCAPNAAGDAWDCTYGGARGPRSYSPPTPEQQYPEFVDRSTGALEGSDYASGWDQVADALRAGIAADDAYKYVSDGQSDEYYQGINEALIRFGFEPLDEETISEFQDMSYE